MAVQPAKPVAKSRVAERKESRDRDHSIHVGSISYKRSKESNTFELNLKRVHDAVKRKRRKKSSQKLQNLNMDLALHINPSRKSSKRNILSPSKFPHVTSLHQSSKRKDESLSNDNESLGFDQPSYDFRLANEQPRRIKRLDVPQLSLDDSDKTPEALKEDEIKLESLIHAHSSSSIEGAESKRSQHLAILQKPLPSLKKSI